MSNGILRFLLLGASIVSHSAGLSIGNNKPLALTVSVTSVPSHFVPSWGTRTSPSALTFPSPHVCFMSSLSDQDENNEQALKRKRRRIRRKDESTKTVTQDTYEGEEDDFTGQPYASTIDIDNDFEVVEVQIRDVRGLGRTASSAVQINSEESGPDSEESFSGRDSRASDSLESLLADAKRLRAAKGGSAKEEGSSIGDAISNVVSTIVTVDFFVVCALLLWFLAGVFSSYVLKDDTVQIAFNGIFQQVVQPALGILMIGSAAGAIMQKGDDDK